MGLIFNFVNFEIDVLTYIFELYKFDFFAKNRDKNQNTKPDRKIITDINSLITD